MTSISAVSASTAPAAVASNTSLAAISAAKPVASSQTIGPAATIDLSQAALARIKGDKDWKPGMQIDSY